MPWKRFALFNFLGAVLWVSVIATVGYKFGKHWDKLLEYIKDLNLALAITAALVILFLWLWHRKRSR